VESELFGHKKGAFTGAVQDRQGWLESCDPLGTVFLDEIGEIEPAIQVKLLRVLQEGVFQRMGENVDRQFHGKVVAATNRDLARAMQEGRFREDLYYRLCADIVRTPSLREQLLQSPEDLPHLVRFVVARDFGDDRVEQDALTREVVDWIHQHLGSDYIWPGNFRELEQCVRNVMIRKQYFPARPAAHEPVDAWIAALRAGELSRDDLLTHYYQLVYRKTRSINGAAKVLKVDPRTVRNRVAHGESGAK
jgi:transcriptional regulator with GAF, ATPase, and Fis domain